MDNREKVIRWLRDPKNRKTIIRIGLPMTVLALIAGGAQIPIAILAATATAGTDSLSSKALDSVVGAVVGYATELAGSKVENQRQVTEHDQRLKFEHDLLASFLRTYAHLVSAQLQSQNLPALAANLVNEIEGVCQDSERLNSFANQLPEGWIKHAVQVRDTEAIHVFLLLPFRTNLVKDNGFPIIGDALLKSAADRAEKLPVKDIQTALVKVLVADPIANQKFSLLKNFADGEYLAKLLEANNVEEFAGTRLDAEQFSQIMDSFVDKLAPLLDRLTDATDTIEAAAVKATRATTSLSDSAERLGPIVDQFQKQSQRAQSMGVSLIASNIPPGLAHYIERADLFTRIRDSLANNKGVSPQALLTGLGGSGKSVLAAGYAKAALDNNEYPGGAYFVGCENRVIVEALSELLLSTDETLKLSTTEKVHFVRSHLAAHESLLIFDNVDSQGQWLEFKTSGLYPTCDILITTRAIDVAGLDPVKVDHFFPKETKQLLAKYSESALLPENEKAIEVIHKETEGLAALVSAVGGSQRQAANPNDWNPYAKWLKAAPINQMPSANEDGYPNKTEIILDARLVKLEPAQLRILEYAAILPADRTRQSWLEWLLDADATSDQDPIDLGTDPTGASYPVKWHLEQLRR